MIRLPSWANGVAKTLASIKARGSWADVGGAVVGGLLYQFFVGTMAIPLGVGHAFQAFAGQIIAGMRAGVTALSTAITRSALAVWTRGVVNPLSDAIGSMAGTGVGVRLRWDYLSLGPLSLPANIAVGLVTLTIAVWLVRRI